MRSLRTLNHLLKLETRNFSKASSSKPPKSTTSPPQQKPVNPDNPLGIKSDVIGLSENVIRKRSGELGPGASPTGVYKVPEYYSFDKTSYYEAEVEMSKFRLPQPSAKH